MRHLFASLLLLLWCAAAGAQSEHIRPDLEPMPTDIGPTFVTIESQVYGAQPSDIGPIGGGVGYTRIITSGDHNVSTLNELRAALAKAKSGEVVFLDPKGNFDMTALTFTEGLALEVPAGVTLAGNRGHEGSRGPVIYSDAHQTAPLIRAMGPGVRITGLWLLGPNPRWHIEHWHRAFDEGEEKGTFRHHDGTGLRGGHPYYYKFPNSTAVATEFDKLEVDNCEISGWTRGVALSSSHDHHIHHNYIHHCQYHGLGYGVAHGRASSLVEYNLFNANRHSIAGSGHPSEGYEARHNVELEVARSFPFDMHGGRDRRDETNIAGSWLKIHNNQFRATDQLAIGIRGRPEQMSFINNNWFFHTDPEKVLLELRPNVDTNVTIENNAFGSVGPRVQ